MYAVNADLRKVPFVGETPTRQIITINGDVPVTWNTEPGDVFSEHEDDRTPLFTRECSCILEVGMCHCAWPMQKVSNAWML